jgi:aminomethyltransferase
MCPFAGWEMPLEYEGVIPEHVAVRSAAGVFDVSHMGQLETVGPRASSLLERLLTNDVASMAIGGAQYGLLLREDGGVLDDVITYRLAENRYLTVTNAANHAQDTAWFQAHAGDDIDVTNVAGDFAMIAVQGPVARAIVGAIADAPLPKRMTIGARAVNGAQALVAGSGYTGEDGVELLLAPRDAADTWTAIVGRGATPAGLAARDTLRIEACYCLYGNELSSERGPVEAGLSWCCRRSGGYIGAAAVESVRAAGASERLAPFLIEGRGVARAGDAVLGGGVVTSGTFSPTLRLGVGMAYLPAERARDGAKVSIDVRGRIRLAVVARRPLVVPLQATNPPTME